MENQSVTIPFTYFMELLKKAEQRDRAHEYLSNERYLSMVEESLAKLIGMEIKEEKEEE